MSDRETEFKRFLNNCGWGTATPTALRPDASQRRYYRLVHENGDSCIAMDIPPHATEKTHDITRITSHLRAIGLGAPDIFAVDHINGFMVIEDLGKLRFADEFLTAPDLQHDRYCAAIDMLVHLQSADPAPDLPTPTPTSLAQMIHPLFSHYYLTPVTTEKIDAITDHLTTIIAQHAAGPQVMSLRDCHAENLIWAPHKVGICRVGIIDFQDAFLTHPAYDLVSLLYDVRRDIDDDLRHSMIQRFITATGHDRDHIMAAIHVINVQRNLRILGVFAKLAQSGKPHYLAWAPRTWDFVQIGLRHPAFTTLAPILRDTVPAPTPEYIARISQC